VGPIHGAGRHSEAALKPHDRRLLAIGGAAVAVLLLGLRVMPAGARAIGRLRESTREKRRLAEESRVLLAATPALEDSLRLALRALVETAPYLIDGRTDAEAGASLQALLNTRVEAAGMHLVRSDAVADSAPGAFRPVRVRAQLEGDVRALARLLGAIEGGSPLLSASMLAVTSADPIARPGAPEVIRVEVEVVGWFLPREER
jgi:type II secretion system (T2SS) protein M